MQTLFSFGFFLSDFRWESPNSASFFGEQFLSDPSPIIGYACHSLPNSLTDWLTDCRLVNLINVTLVCEDGNSKLVEVVTVVDVDAEDNVGNSLLQIWELTFGSKAKLLFRIWAQGLVKILKLKFRQDLKLVFGQYFAANEIWSNFVFELVIWLKKSYFGKRNSTLTSAVPSMFMT